MIGIDIIFSLRVSDEIEHVVDLMVTHLQRLRLVSFINGFNGEEVLLKNAARYISVKGKKSFLMCREKDEINFTTSTQYEFSRLRVKGFFISLSDAICFVDDMAKFNSFTQARIYDHVYDLWQNMDDIQYFESEGVDHSMMAKKSNGLPYPLGREIIDTSKNPGRWYFKKGYLECIGSIMWFGNDFWERVGYEKRQKLLEEKGFGSEIINGSVVKLLVMNECFIDESTSNEQNFLRRILYGNI